MAKFIITFKVDTDDLDEEILQEYLQASDKENPTEDELHDALRKWIDDDVNKVLGDELFWITEDKGTI